MKTIPSSIGIWVWQPQQCEGGDWNKIVAKCKQAGIKWITAKSGDSTRYSYWTTAYLQNVINICHSNGILFYTWNYSLPTTYQQQVQQIKSLADDGVDGHFIDAEIEWQNAQNSNQLAETFMQSLRAEVGDLFIAHAPFSIVNYHPTFPYVGFGKYVDAVCDQAYWTEFNWSVQQTIQLSDQAWTNFNQTNPSAAKPRWPIGVSYGKGYPGVPGVLNEADIITFINHYAGLPISFYSYDASVNFPAFWNALNSIQSQNQPVVSPIVQNVISVLNPAQPATVIQQSTTTAQTTTTSIQNVNANNILNSIKEFFILLGKWLFHIR